jgi:hypothetical protein
MPQEFDGTLTLDPTGFAYSTSAGPLQVQAWPRYAFHATEPPRVVGSKDEFEALGEGWTLQYQHKDYPKAKFDDRGNTIIVNNPEDEAALEGTWTDTPPPGQPAGTLALGQHTLQSKAEAIRDSRRLSLDYVQLNQDLDLKADNIAMREISPQDVPRPQFKSVETAEQIRERREKEEEESRKRREEAAEKRRNK